MVSLSEVCRAKVLVPQAEERSRKQAGGRCRPHRPESVQAYLRAESRQTDRLDSCLSQHRKIWLPVSTVSSLFSSATWWAGRPCWAVDRAQYLVCGGLWFVGNWSLTATHLQWAWQILACRWESRTLNCPSEQDCSVKHWHTGCYKPHEHVCCPPVCHLSLRLQVGTGCLCVCSAATQRQLTPWSQRHGTPSLRCFLKGYVNYLRPAWS